MASDRPQEELNLRFVICCVTCVTKKRSIKISGCKKCQSNLARAQFSHFSLPFPEDFTMDEDQKPTKLRDLEIDFLKEQLNGFSVEGDYCFGYFEGNKAEMDDLLVLFQALNSTCYVLTESYSKEKKLQQIFSNRYNILNQPKVAKVYQIIVETYWSEFFVSSQTNNVLLLDVFKQCTIFSTFVMYNSVYINAFKEKSKNIDMNMTKEMLSIY